MCDSICVRIANSNAKKNVAILKIAINFTKNCETPKKKHQVTSVILGLLRYNYSFY